MCYFVSNMLLVYILFDILSTQLEDESTQNDSTSETRSSVMVEEFDAEAEMNARIWNNFIKRVKNA
jgi:hypothetical protein